MLRPAASPMIAPMTGIDVPVVEESCQQTDYDGIADYIRTTSATVKLAGYQTWCFRFKTDDETVFQSFMNSQVAARTTGINFISHSNGSQYINAAIGGVNKEASDATSFVNDTWYKMVLVFSATEMAFWKNGTKCSGPLAIDANVNAPVNDLDFGFYNPTSNLYFNGRMTNFEIYSGAATNPASWIPGDTDSLSGTTLVMNSPNGNGDNDQGITFSEGGSPTLEDCD